MSNNNLDFIDAFYTLIEKLYSTNYSCERVSNQIHKNTTPGKFQFKAPDEDNTS